jgi:succinate dehydrogenase / fumarate reductase flavoprotein subunit
VSGAQIDGIVAAAVAPLERDGGENPYELHHELQSTMQSLVGIIRNGPELEQAQEKLSELRERAGKIAVKGGRAYNPGWNMATDLPSMLTVSTAVTQGALARKESRGGPTREDFPGPNAELGKVNFVQRQVGEYGYTAPIHIGPEPLSEMPAELKELLEEGH